MSLFDTEFWKVSSEFRELYLLLSERGEINPPDLSFLKHFDMQMVAAASFGKWTKEDESLAHTFLYCFPGSWWRRLLGLQHPLYNLGSRLILLAKEEVIKKVSLAS